MISPPINKELSFGYTLVPLSAFFDIFDFFDVDDIMGFDVGGVGWGVKSLWVFEASCFVESLTPLSG